MKIYSLHPTRWVWFVLVGLILGLPLLALSQTSFPPPSAAAQSGTVDMELVGSTGGWVTNVMIEGSYAYVGEGYALTILDVTTPSQPRRVGHVSLPFAVNDIVLDGGYVYIANGEAGVSIVDVSTPTNPTKISTYDTPGSARGVYIVGSVAYVADGDSGLQIIDISTPANPIRKGSFTTSTAQDVFVVGTQAYIADWQAGLRIVNVSNPSIPSQTALFDTPGNANAVQVVGSFAYIADESNGLRIVSVSNPAAPYEVGFYDTNNYAHDVQVVNGYAYVADGSEGLRVLNVNNPSSPSLEGFYNTAGTARALHMAGTLAYLADLNAGLQIIDVTNTKMPSLVGSFEPVSDAVAIQVEGDTAYVANGDAGLVLIDVANPAAPNELGIFNTPGSAEQIHVVGEHAFVAQGEGGVQIIDVSNPQNLTQLGSFDTPGKAKDVYVVQDTVFVADESEGLRIVDVSNVSQPNEIGFIDTLGNAYGVYVTDSYAYVACYDTGLWIVDVSNPAAPQQVKLVDTPGYAYNVAVVGSYAYVADWSSGIQIVDVSTPATASIKGFFDTEGFAEDVHVAGTYAYVADGNSGLQIFDVNNPSVPAHLGSFALNGYASSVQVVGDLAYIATEQGGVQIVRGNLSDIPTPTPVASSTPSESTPTHTPTSVSTSVSTPTSTPNVPSNTPDAYETDNTCGEASTIATDGSIQNHSFHETNDIDWVSFDVVSSTTYLIEAKIPPGSEADVIAQLYKTCDSSLPEESQDNTFAPGTRIEFVATADETLYLSLQNNDSSISGSDVQYNLSISDISTPSPVGALIVVAGKIRDGDSLQPNIHNIAQRVIDIFERHGYTSDDIMYLATDLQLPNVDALATVSHLEAAITDWANQRLTSDRALTLYLIDHGGQDYFYLDKKDKEWITPAQLDGWLTQIESSHPGIAINVIIEACHSGSFINTKTNTNALQSISRHGRVIVTSTSREYPAWASDEGAIFSDYLLDSLAQASSIYNSFQSARWAAEMAHQQQTPWLDADGDGIPNEVDDATIASTRGFGYAGTLEEDEWEPYIVQVEQPESITQGNGIIRAEVRDDVEVDQVLASIYPPSYIPPEIDGEMVTDEDIIETIVLKDVDQEKTDWYSGRYSGFDEIGTYRIVVYAKDNNDLEARPLAIEVTVGAETTPTPTPSPTAQPDEGDVVYLPMVKR